MSNHARFMLSVADQAFLQGHFDAASRKSGVICREYGLNPRRISRWRSGVPMGRRVYNNLQKLIGALRVNPDGVLAAIELPSNRPRTQSDLNTALRLARGVHFKGALPLVLAAFDDLSAAESVEEAVALIPKIVYIGHHFCVLRPDGVLQPASNPRVAQVRRRGSASAWRRSIARKLSDRYRVCRQRAWL